MSNQPEIGRDERKRFACVMETASSICIVSAKTRTCELHASYNHKCNAINKTGPLTFNELLKALWFLQGGGSLISESKETLLHLCCVRAWNMKRHRLWRESLCGALFTIMKMEKIAWNLIKPNPVLSQNLHVWAAKGEEVAESGALDFHCLLCLPRWNVMWRWVY